MFSITSSRSIIRNSRLLLVLLLVIEVRTTSITISLTCEIVTRAGVIILGRAGHAELL